MYKLIKMCGGLEIFFLKTVLGISEIYCSRRRNFFSLEILIYKGEMMKNILVILFKNASRKFIMHDFQKNVSIHIFNEV